MNTMSTRAVVRGLARVEPTHGEVVFYAARDGRVAEDGAGGNSPFATALVKHMDEEGVELGRFFRRVTSTVLAGTGNQQEPFVYGRIPDEDFYGPPSDGGLAAPGIPVRIFVCYGSPASLFTRGIAKGDRCMPKLSGGGAVTFSASFVC